MDRSLDLLVLLDELGRGRRRVILDRAQVDGEERGLVEEDVDVELPEDLAHVDAALRRSKLLGLLLTRLHDLVRDRVAAEHVRVLFGVMLKRLARRQVWASAMTMMTRSRLQARIGVQERRASDGRAKLGISSSASL